MTGEGTRIIMEELVHCQRRLLGKKKKEEGEGG